MSKDYRRLFIDREAACPEDILFDKIIRNIGRKQRFLFLRELTIFSVGLIGSSIAILPISKFMISEFSQSNFWQFFSLIFSNLDAVISYWDSFALALLESLPLFSVIIFLITIFVLLESIKSLANLMFNADNLINI